MQTSPSFVPSIIRYHPLPHRRHHRHRNYLQATANPQWRRPPKRTATLQHTDARNDTWNFTIDTLPPSITALSPTTAKPKAALLLLLHPPDALGTSRHYWDSLLSHLQQNAYVLHRYTIIRFDWIGSNDTIKRNTTTNTPPPTTVHDLTAQLETITQHLNQTYYNLPHQTITLLAQGGAETIALTYAATPRGRQNITAGITTTGWPTPSVTQTANATTTQLQYAIFTSPLLSNPLWQILSSSPFVTTFSKRFLLHRNNAQTTHAFTKRATETAQRYPNSRFLTYSALSGSLNGDYTDAMAAIEAEWLFVAGGEDGRREGGSDGEGKMRHRCEVMRRCEGVVLPTGGKQMFWEEVADAARVVQLFLETKGV